MSLAHGVTRHYRSFYRIPAAYPRANSLLTSSRCFSTKGSGWLRVRISAMQGLPAMRGHGQDCSQTNSMSLLLGDPLWGLGRLRHMEMMERNWGLSEGCGRACRRDRRGKLRGIKGTI